MKLIKNYVKLLLNEAKFTATPPARLKLPSEEVEADDSRDAGNKASQLYRSKHHAIVDPFTISIDEIPEPEPAPAPKQVTIDDLFDFIRQKIFDESVDEDDLNTMLLEFGIVDDDAQTIIDGVIDVMSAAESRGGAMDYSDAKRFIEAADKLAKNLNDAFPDYKTASGQIEPWQFC